MQKFLRFVAKGLRILLDRLRTQGLRTTLVWVWGRGFPKLTGIPLVRYSQITPELYVGGQYGARGKRKLERLGVTGGVNMRIEFDDAAHGLAEGDPLSGVGFLAHEVVSFPGVAHGQHIVGEPGGLVPSGGQGDMALHLLFVFEGLEPHEAVGINPHRIVDPGEIDVDLAAPFFKEMGQQKAHFEKGEGPFMWQMQFVPCGAGRGYIVGLGYELVPTVGRCATPGADAASQDIEEEEGAGDLPAT